VPFLYSSATRQEMAKEREKLYSKAKDVMVAISKSTPPIQMRCRGNRDKQRLDSPTLCNKKTRRTHLIDAHHHCLGALLDQIGKEALDLVHGGLEHARRHGCFVGCLACVEVARPAARLRAPAHFSAARPPRKGQTGTRACHHIFCTTTSIET
jgi:hypothetical protein